MKILLATLVLFALAGCASFMQPNAGMSAEQISAAVKDKSATVICSTLIGPYGTAKLVTINLDQNAIKDGGITVDGDRGCSATITSAAPPRPPVVVSPAPAKPATP